MPPLRVLAGTQYFTGLQLPSLQSPAGWEIVWRKEGRALPLGGRGPQGQKEGACESQKVGASDEVQRGISWGKKGCSLGWTTTSEER